MEQLGQISQGHEAEVSRTREEIQLLINETGTCPFRGHIMDLAHFLELLQLFKKFRSWVLVGNHDKHEARLTSDLSLSSLKPLVF